ncbi:hypothetical protein P7L78_14480 [Tistrella bauzanensis]|jgi:hypothetical protein|uniref:UrcA family protein n=1 Tax=Tistrella arctica TaxID=3133430 RepID=A0ABU9YHA9_9PROT
MISSLAHARHRSLPHSAAAAALFLAMTAASSLAPLTARAAETVTTTQRSSCRSAVQTLAKLVADPPQRDRRVADYIAARQHLDRANRACDGNEDARAMAEADAGIRRLAPDLRGGILR